MTTLKEIRFGVEIETAGATRSFLAQAVLAACNGLGLGPCTISNTHDTYSSVLVKMADGRAWRLMNDGSIATLNGVIGTEIVSPILVYGDMELLQTVIRAAKSAGAQTDASCGIHVHVDGAAFKAKPMAIKNLTRLWDRYEALVGIAIDLLPARRARWCKPVEPTFLARLDAMKIPTLEGINRAWYGHLSTGATHYDDTRYHALNLHAIWNKGTVEFRCFNGTLHAGKVKGYVQFCLATAAYALNAKTVRRAKRDFDPTWTAFPIFYHLKNLGLVGEEYATCRKHMMAQGKGVAGFKTAAMYHAWKVRQGRVAAPVAAPALHTTSDTPAVETVSTTA